MSESRFVVVGARVGPADETESWACVECGGNLLVHGARWRWTPDGGKAHSNEPEWPLSQCLPREGAE